MLVLSVSSIKTFINPVYKNDIELGGAIEMKSYDIWDHRKEHKPYINVTWLLQYISDYLFQWVCL